MTPEAIAALERHSKALRLNSAALMNALTPELAGEYCGVGRTRLWQAVKSGELSQAKRGKLVYFRRQDLEAWMLCGGPKSELEKPKRASRKYGVAKEAL